MLNDHFEAEKNGDESSTMLHYVRLGSNLKTLQFDEDTGPVLKHDLRTTDHGPWLFEH